MVMETIADGTLAELEAKCAELEARGRQLEEERLSLDSALMSVATLRDDKARIALVAQKNTVLDRLQITRKDELELRSRRDKLKLKHNREKFAHAIERGMYARKLFVKAFRQACVALGVVYDNLEEATKIWNSAITDRGDGLPDPMLNRALFAELRRTISPYTGWRNMQHTRSLGYDTSYPVTPVRKEIPELPIQGEEIFSEEETHDGTRTAVSR